MKVTFLPHHPRSLPSRLGGRHPRHRLALIGALASLFAGLLAACAPPQVSSAPLNITPVKPKHPITMTLLDGGGDLAVYQGIYQDFVKTHPDLVKSIRFETASAPDVLGKLRAQELSHHVGISIIAAGSDVLGALQQQSLLTPLLPKHKSLLPDLSKIQDKPRAQMQALAHGQAVINLWGPSGPFWEYDSNKLPNPPKTPQALLAWAKAHPGRFTYAQPANSGPGRQFMMSLPYILGDKNPQDPVNGWDKTWAYLKELGKYSAAYPSSSTLMNKQLADSSVWLVPSITAMDFNNHLENVWGAEQKFTISDPSSQAWIMDSHYEMVPRGVSPETLYVDLAFISWVLQPAQQLRTYAYGVVSTAVTDAPLSQAGAASQAIQQKYGHPGYWAKAFKVGRTEVPLDPVVQRTAFDQWQRRIGSQVGG
jgi:putative spermidine/putrescine transport system substrate-binding protein